MTRRGFTMLELVLSLAITVLVAAGVAAMLGGIATGIALGSDTRTGLLATAATHGRLTEDLAGIASVLERSDDGRAMVIWNGDVVAGGRVEPSELRWLEFDPVRGELRRSEIRFPTDWTPLERAEHDRPISGSIELAEAFRRAEQAGILHQDVLVDGLVDAVIGSANVNPRARELRLDLTFDLATGPLAATTIVPCHDLEPEVWRP
ncbi:MAG: hypothetical protein CMJ27_06005 [Phycisphaerae bacterium]|nr:hypothetical protein [Phycisphaerae bacterium]OUX01746.1 MAG: hypothetical protein CBD91_03815 [Phycisphaeraceae bacterium TMED231]